MKRKNVCGRVLALRLTFSLTACGGSVPADEGKDASAETGDTILLGTISPNTGSLAAYGTAIVNGAALAVEEINEAGGIGGRQLKLVSADDQGDPTECMNAFKRPSQILCKPPMWCRIEAPHRRFYI